MRKVLKQKRKPIKTQEIKARLKRLGILVKASGDRLT